jgi:hypothetical protein
VNILGRRATHPSIDIGRLDIALRARFAVQGVRFRQIYMQIGSLLVVPHGRTGVEGRSMANWSFAYSLHAG